MPQLGEFEAGNTRAPNSRVGKVSATTSSNLEAVGDAVGSAGSFFQRRADEMDKNEALRIMNEHRGVWTSEHKRLSNSVPRDGMVSSMEGSPDFDEQGNLVNDGDPTDMDEPVTYTKYVKDRYFADIDRRLEGQSPKVQKWVREGINQLWTTKFNKYHVNAEVSQVKKTNALEYLARLDESKNELRNLPNKGEFDLQGYEPQEILDINIKSADKAIDLDTSLTDENEKEARKKLNREGLADAYIRRRLETDPEFIKKQLEDGKLNKYLSEEQLNLFLGMADRSATKAEKDRIDGLQFELTKSSEGMRAEIRNKGATSQAPLTQEDFNAAYKTINGAKTAFRSHELNTKKASIDFNVRDTFSKLDLVDSSHLVAQQKQVVATATGDAAILASYTLSQMSNARDAIKALADTDPASLGRIGSENLKADHLSPDEQNKALDSASLINQSRNGVTADKVRILTNAEADRIGGLATGAALFSERGAIDAELAIRQSFADHPGQEAVIMRQLIQDNKIDPRIEVLMAIDNPSAKQSIRKLISQFGSVAELKEGIDSDDIDDMDTAVNEAMGNFNISTSDNPTAEAGRNLGRKVTKVVKQLAYLLKSENSNMTSAEAAEQAYQTTIGEQYGFVEWNDGDSIRIPKTLMGKDSAGNPVSVANPHAETVIPTAVHDWLNNIDQSDLLTTSDAGQNLSEAEEQNMFINTFRSKDKIADEKQVSAAEGLSNLLSLDRAFEFLTPIKRESNIFDDGSLRDRPDLTVRLNDDETRLEIWVKGLNGVDQPVKTKSGSTLSRSLLDLKAEGDEILYNAGDHPAEGNALMRAVTFSRQSVIDSAITKSQKEVSRAKGEESFEDESNFDLNVLLKDAEKASKFHKKNK